MAHGPQSSRDLLKETRASVKSKEVLEAFGRMSPLSPHFHSREPGITEWVRVQPRLQEDSRVQTVREKEPRRGM